MANVKNSQAINDAVKQSNNNNSTNDLTALKERVKSLLLFQSINQIVKVLIDIAIDDHDELATELILSVVASCHAIEHDFDNLDEKSSYVRDLSCQYIESIKRNQKFITKNGCLVEMVRITNNIYQCCKIDSFDKVFNIFLSPQRAKGKKYQNLEIDKYYEIDNKADSCTPTKLKYTQICDLHQSENVEKKAKLAIKQRQKALDVVHASGYKVIDKDAKLWSELDKVEKIAVFVAYAKELGITLTDEQITQLSQKQEKAKTA